MFVDIHPAIRKYQLDVPNLVRSNLFVQCYTTDFDDAFNCQSKGLIVFFGYRFKSVYGLDNLNVFL